MTSVTFCVIAKDRNDVTGPGVTISRPIVVSSADRMRICGSRRTMRTRNCATTSMS